MHDHLATEIIDVMHGDIYLKDAVLILIDIFHRENKRSYEQDVIVLKNVIDGAILLEDLDKGSLPSIFLS